MRGAMAVHVTAALERTLAAGGGFDSGMAPNPAYRVAGFERAELATLTDSISAGVPMLSKEFALQLSRSTYLCDNVCAFKASIMRPAIYLGICFDDTWTRMMLLSKARAPARNSGAQVVGKVNEAAT
jgi:hypothetical protein